MEEELKNKISHTITLNTCNESVPQATEKDY